MAFYIFFLFYACGCFACIYVGVPLTSWCQRMLEEGGDFPGTGVKDGYARGTLEEQPLSCAVLIVGLF